MPIFCNFLKNILAAVFLGAFSISYAMEDTKSQEPVLDVIGTLNTLGLTNYSLETVLGNKDAILHQIVKRITAKESSYPVAQKYLELIRWFLKNKANPNSYNDEGQTVLHHAIDVGFVDIVELLLEYGVNLTLFPRCTGMAFNPLARALKLLAIAKNAYAHNESLQERYAQIVAVLKHARAHPCVIRYENELIRVLRDKLADQLRNLIRYGIDINATFKVVPKDGKTSYDSTALLYAIEAHYSADMVKLLLRYGAQIPEIKAGYGTLLHYALKTAQEETAKLLIERGADVTARDPVGDTSLHCFVQFCKSKDLFELLLKKGADVNAVNLDGATPLYLALTAAQEEAAKLLIEHGADVTARDTAGDTLLHYYAKRCKSRDLLELLLEKGLEINAVNLNGATPLHYALKAAQEETAKLLIEHNADVNARDYGGVMPVHHCVYYCQAKSLLELLFEKGAEVNSVTVSKITPLHFVACKTDCSKAHEFAEILLGKGADVNALDMWGNSPLCQAIVRNNMALIRLLVKRGAQILLSNIKLACDQVGLHQVRKYNQGHEPITDAAWRTQKAGMIAESLAKKFLKQEAKRNALENTLLEPYLSQEETE